MQVSQYRPVAARLVAGALDGQASIATCQPGYYTGFWVEFPFPASADAEKTSVKTPVEILRLLTANSSMTLAEVAAEIGKTPRAVELAKGRPLGSFDMSTQALAGGLIEMTLPDKPTSRLQQYRLTAAGRSER